MRFLAFPRCQPAVAALAALAALMALMALMALTACGTLAPRYERPAAPVPAQFRDAPAASSATGVDAEDAPLDEWDWREVFLDDRLRQVIALALNNNRDLRVAVLNIEKARAQYRIQRADLLPSVQASVGQSAARSSAASSGSNRSTVERSASATVGFSSWELDLFGRIRSLSDQALETYLATGQTQRGTRMSLVAEVAGAWLTVGADQARLALARQTLQSQRESLRLTERRYALGAVSGVDFNQARSSVESARADVAAYTTALAQARNALELVAGGTVDDRLLPVPAGGQGDEDIDGQGGVAVAVALAPLPADLSSSVLLRRPDVRYAEHTLKAANANIGAARAAFFPAISLTASAGRGSDALSTLLGSGTRTWSFVPSITLPIFEAGSLQASLQVATVEKEIAVAEYEQAIQNAFGEVADALAARANIGEQLDAQGTLVQVTQRGYALATARYRQGVDSYLEALDTQRTLYSAQQDLITLRLEEAVNRVTLYKVLGGGADADANTDIGANVSAVSVR